MEGPLEPGPAQMRISDDDRHRVAEILREAAGEGRLDLDELDERLEATYAARTYSDLVPITSDLPPPQPRHAPARPASAEPATRHDSSIAIMGGVDRKGVWEVGPRHTAFAMMGGVDIDLREAVFTSAETVITANAFWAGIDVIVNERTRVVVEGVGVLGAFDQVDKVPPQLAPDSPVVRVRGVALMAGVTVVRKGPKRFRRPRSLHRPH
ncbi:DUF1707 domain-containing protein [Nocardioides sp. YIM 152315]|uniref:DUF1707 SHOCT-like domain-containing protein n=1 Tax=Nocardioides sp. YIM 152315 TaxID=3031760 RepID=UPI0023D9867D|nr:DUF1707 domain-containing protein [Nocardioides sp. YIM 152315]MDF1605392.1 DUF1707 domain-containing protein [Nocardioides sp. YIM 152315]